MYNNKLNIIPSINSFQNIFIIYVRTLQYWNHLKEGNEKKEFINIPFKTIQDKFKLNIIDIDLLSEKQFIERREQISSKGIKYFKNDPPANYRAYMTSNQMPADFKADMVEYLERTPDIRPSKSFENFLAPNRYHHSTIWLWSNYFVDYDDERNLMMMHLMFPSAIGKTYKLEKK